MEQTLKVVPESPCGSLCQTWDLAVWIGAAGLSFSPHWSAAAAPPPQGVNGPGRTAKGGYTGTRMLMGTSKRTDPTKSVLLHSKLGGIRGHFGKGYSRVGFFYVLLV